MSKEMTDPAMLFDALIKELRLKNDADLARKLGVKAPTISNMRAGRLKVGPSLILAIMENCHFPLPRIRRLLAGIED